MSSKYSQSNILDLLSDSDGDDTEEDLEVLPPRASAAASSTRRESHSASPSRRGPRLSASGGNEADPIALLDEESDDDEDDCSLVDRLRRRKGEGEKFLAAKLNNNHHTSSYAQFSQSSMQKNASAAFASCLESSDDDSCDSPDKKPKACRQSLHSRSKKASTLAAAASSSDNASSCSEDSLTKRIKQMVRTKPKATTNKNTVSDKQAASKENPIDLNSSAPAAAKPKRKQPDAAIKEHRQREKEEERLRKQQERDQAKQLKEQEKLAKKRAREAKLEAEKTEKRRKQELKDDSKQRKGGFANQEIVVLMDPDLYRHPELTIADELQDLKYNVVEHASMLGCKTIQYIRKDLKRGEGGAEGAMAAMRSGNVSGYEHLPAVAVVFDDAHEFIKLLERDDYDDDDYPKLENWLRSLQAGWRAAWRCEPTKKPRLLIYLYRVTHKLEQLWIAHKRNKQPNSSAPPTDEELKDAIAWLLIQFQVECIECRENDHLAMELNRLTRKLSDVQYQKAYSDLDVSQKLAPLCGADATLYAQAKDCWLRQVQQLPRVSFNMARMFVQHYPTGYSLWKVYQDVAMTEDEKRLLLVDCFGDKTYAKLSNQVFELMTSDNPNFLLV